MKTNSNSRRTISLIAFLFLLFFTLQSTAFSQDKEWRPITDAEIKSAPVVDPDADAEAIFWEVKIDNSSSDGLTRRHYVRVKIFTERGRERYSKFDIQYIRGIKIKDLAARVIKSDGTIVEVGKADIFDREIIKTSGLKVKAKSFAVPNIEPGVIVEYRYKEVIDGGNAVGMRLDFQKDIPVQNLSYYYKTYDKKEPKTQSYNFTGTSFQKGSDGYYLAQRTNIPAFKEEPRMPPENMVKPWMLLTGTETALTGFTGTGITFVVKDPTNPSKYWGAVGSQQLPRVKAMLEAAKDKEMKSLAEQIVAGANTPEEKLAKIYSYCQTQISNTDYDPTITDEMRAKLPVFKDFPDMIKRRSGNYYRINMLFGVLATVAGLEATYVLGSNRSEMFFDPTMTNDDLISFAGIGIKLGEGYKLFNPGIKYAPYGELPWSREDSWALFIGEKEFNWQQTGYAPPAKTGLKRTGKFRLLEDGTLEGDVDIELTGHRALSFRLDYYDESQDKRESAVKDEVKRRLSQAEVSAVSIENLEDTSRPLIQHFKVRIPAYAQKTGKRLFFQPGFFESGESPLFSSADRKFDIFFAYPWSENDTIEIKYPSNFDLDNGDSPAAVFDNSKITSDTVSIKVDKTNSVIFYNRQFYFGEGGRVLFKSNYYAPLKSLWDAINKTDTHQLSLKQK